MSRSRKRTGREGRIEGSALLLFFILGVDALEDLDDLLGVGASIRVLVPAGLHEASELEVRRVGELVGHGHPLSSDHLCDHLHCVHSLVRWRRRDDLPQHHSETVFFFSVRKVCKEKEMIEVEMDQTCRYQLSRCRVRC